MEKVKPEDLKLVNLHTHCQFCGHSNGMPADFCAEVSGRINCIGFSDHGPYPDDFAFGDRMKYAMMPEYSAALDAAQEQYKDMNILRGLEIEWRKELGKDFYQEYREKFRLDYFAGSAHYTEMGDKRLHFAGFTPDKKSIRSFVDTTLAMIESEVYDFIAHPDAFMNKQATTDSELESWFNEIFCAAKQYNIPLEVNANGIRGKRCYPCRRFWELAGAYDGIRVIVNSDAHYLGQVYDDAMADVVNLALETGNTPCNNEVAAGILKKRRS